MDYVSVKIPKVLATKINLIAERDGYRSVSEFVMEAVRIHIKDMKSQVVVLSGDNPNE